MILVDTGPLVALCDARDALHAGAVRHLTKLATTRMATCEAVLAEACFLLPLASQRQRLNAFLTEMDVQGLASTADFAFRTDVFDWLAKYADHEPDLADGCLAVLSGQHSKARVWTYDREFRTTWRRPDGTRIPLAVALRVS